MIQIWHGENQRIGHLGTAQEDFNVLGHVENWQDVDRMFWQVNKGSRNPLEFRAFRRLVEDGDFNADVPISWLQPGDNTVQIIATTREGTEIRNSIHVSKEEGRSTLPYEIDWSQVKNPQDVGQYVDGHWILTKDGLRTAEVGYDRIFLIGERDWRDYEVTVPITLHAVPEETSPVSGGNGVGVVWRFTGHVVGGPREFPAAQPKWGYQPFGAIGFLRWPSDHSGPPYLQFYPGYRDKPVDYGRFPYDLETPYVMRLKCETLPDSPDGMGVTRYSFKIWKSGEPEPADWTWSHVQTNEYALREGGLALLAHHIDVTFGNVRVTAVQPPH